MKPQAPRTYTLFWEYFYEAHCELTKTTTSAGYHSSNAVKDAAYEKLASEFAAYKIEVNKKNAKSLPSTPPKPKLATDKKDMSYCWTHSYMSNTKHTSATCKSRGAGHVDEAETTSWEAVPPSGSRRLRRNEPVGRLMASK
jgi:hypothetical protein